MNSMTPQDIQDLKMNYEAMVNIYISLFCEKQELTFDEWLRDRIAVIASFNDAVNIDYAFSFEDIRYDIETNQPKHRIIDWTIYYKYSSNGNHFGHYKEYCNRLDKQEKS